jgi:hydroxyacylglutathione hydrolase
MMKTFGVALLLCLSGTVLANVALEQKPDVTQWFSHQLLAPGVWVINDNDQDKIYLIEGDERALVIDTGLGLHDLKSYVESLTNKPLLVVNTHGHPDHAGGNRAFDKVHIHKDELETLHHYTSLSVMSDTFERFAKQTLPAHFTNGEKAKPLLIEIDEGFTFDLGNRVLKVIHIPGHTPGSIALYDPTSRYLITGDMANTHVWMQIKHATSIDDLGASLSKLRALDVPIKALLPGHGEPLSLEHLSTLHLAAEKLLAGTCQIVPYKSPFGDEVACEYEGVFIVHKP